VNSPYTTRAVLFLSRPNMFAVCHPGTLNSCSSQSSPELFPPPVCQQRRRASFFWPFPLPTQAVSGSSVRSLLFQGLLRCTSFRSRLCRGLSPPHTRSVAEEAVFFLPLRACCLPFLPGHRAGLFSPPRLCRACRSTLLQRFRSSVRF